MSVWNDKAVAPTARAAGEALTAGWAGLDAAVQRQVAAAIRQPLAQIATAQSPFAAYGQATALLDALWGLADQLPAAAVNVLRAGQAGPSVAVIMRGPLGSVDSRDGGAIVAAFRPVVDLRIFVDPLVLSDQITAEIAANEERLTPEERREWQALKATHASVTTLDAAADYLRRIEALLGHYERIRGLLEAGKGFARRPTMRSAAESFIGSREVGGQPKSALPPAAMQTPAAVERYGNVYFPAQVMRTQEWVPLVVHLAQEYATPKGVILDKEQARLTVTLGDLTLFLRADGFTLEAVVGGQPLAGLPMLNARVVRVEPEHDCEPVVFFLTPKAVGPQRITIDIYQLNRQAGALAFMTEVVEPDAFGAPGRAEVQPLGLTCGAANAPVKLPDWELRVSLGGDQRTLSYAVRAPAADGLRFRPAGQKVLKVEPLKVLGPIFDRLSTLAKRYGDERTPDATQAALGDLRDIGTNLYTDLFSDELKALYLREMRGATPGDQSLVIMSDEPWIPWEMARPFGLDMQGKAFVDPPLCEMYRLARWGVGPGAPAQWVTESGALVAPPGNLAAAAAERSYFLDKAERFRWGSDLSGLLTTVGQVTQAFEAAKTRLYHFSCHGNINNDDPNDSKLKLGDGYLRASQITANAQLGLGQARPLVFLNACHAGRIGIGLTGLGGWAERFVGAGASAFVGAQWEIRDELAAQFAAEFYNRLWGLGPFDGQPMPLGQALYAARQVIKTLDEANPTWLAYVLYGDPLGEVHLGQ